MNDDKDNVDGEIQLLELWRKGAQTLNNHTNQINKMFVVRFSVYSLLI